jgi:hypothetical protein
MFAFYKKILVKFGYEPPFRGVGGQKYKENALLEGKKSDEAWESA